MLSIFGRTRRACSGPTRRELLQVGGAGLVGLSLPRVWAAEAIASPAPARAKSVLFVFLYGGPSQLETFDMKPLAPSGVRGPFRPIASRNPDLLVCEHLPKLAERADRYCTIRTVNHPQNDHNGTHVIQTGRPIPPADRGAAQVDATDKDWPAYGSVVTYLDEQRGQQPAFPSYVYLPRLLGHFAGYDINGQYAGWLGKAYNPLAANIQKRDAGDNPYFRNCTDDELDFRLAGLDPLPGVALDRLDRRRDLRSQLETSRRDFDQSPAVRNLTGLRERAMNLLASPQIAAAFDIRREPASLRDAYGRNLFGQSLLMGRRMIESGARFVTVAWDLAVRGDVCGSWDMHSCLERVMRDHLLPGLDHGLSALLDDLEARGLLDETLVMAVGEMGRTPKFENRGEQDGRDHWTYCFPCILAGGGIQRGLAYGKSDAHAAHPIEHAVSPADLAATLYHSLGIDPELRIPDAEGRPVPLVENGRILTEVLE